MSDKALFDVADRLDKQVDASRAELEQIQQKQGFAGNLVDLAKNNIGGSAQDLPWYHPGALWSNVVSYDAGSMATRANVEAAKQKTEQLKAAAQCGDEKQFAQIYQELTSGEFSSSDSRTTSPNVVSKVKEFDDSQRAGVDVLADVAAFGSSALFMQRGLRQSIQGCMLGGGSAKMYFKQLDGAYPDTTADFVTGSVAGLTMPLGRSASTFVVGRIPRGLYAVPGVTAVADGTVQGGVFGVVDEPVRHLLHQTQSGSEIKPIDVVASAGKGLLVGGIGGGVLSAGNAWFAS